MKQCAEAKENIQMTLKKNGSDVLYHRFGNGILGHTNKETTRFYITIACQHEYGCFIKKKKLIANLP
jgi:hypothetical protein